MTLVTQFKNKNILVLGLGLTGLSCVRYLASQGLTFAVNDSRATAVEQQQFNTDFPQVNLSLGGWDSKKISVADIIIVSPGIDLNNNDITPYINEHCQVLGDVELFFQVLNADNVQIPTLAITGSNGKSTVVTLLAHIGEQLGLTVCLAGNIGTPIMDLLIDNKYLSCDALILELSSFQLETLSSMQANGASILNISDDHLDRHKTLQNYQKIKQSIYQQAQTLVINRDDVLTQPCNSTEQQHVISFGSDAPQKAQFGLAIEQNELQLMFADQALIAVNKLPISGIHNALNCLAALALGQTIGWSLAAMVKALPSFIGLAHRCQVVASDDGIIWINDSKATNVGSTLAALEGLAKTKQTDQQLILIAGGEGKGADFSPLAPVINKEVALLITLGKDADKLACLTPSSVKTTSLIAAVKLANQQAKQGDIVLLSPACASLDMFKNFAERGNVFIEAVQNLAVHKEIANKKIVSKKANNSKSALAQNERGQLND
ncbi:MAG: UDP-N-acetylmuramoyl-L-alanine--D-glutamate ligase [Alteromonadaceae bacterium]|nr:UDP-N-acetylmuramoyl-L-alanine--D-glutamate ligase [Alteromonadaceae bacterium]PCI62935.1 MAG: UDP-N-acetylmuramoyl-L-alanine--D-glutamate ligase [Gammaproteobacteria bacterium]